jgi:DHA1 family bicyclomycin/chloramphenicol resistance-like MFS transporter
MILIGALLTFAGLVVQTTLFAVGFSHPALFFGMFTFVGLGNGMVLPNATSGMLSVRPHLAGTASGLGGAMMIGGGAALSALAGQVLSPGSGPLPLLSLMVVTSAMSLVAVMLVLRRERRLLLAG